MLCSISRTSQRERLFLEIKRIKGPRAQMKKMPVVLILIPEFQKKCMLMVVKWILNLFVVKVEVIILLKKARGRNWMMMNMVKFLVGKIPKCKQVLRVVRI